MFSYKNYHFLSILFFLSLHCSFAQYEQWSTIQYKKDRGLPSNLVKGVAQDSLGIVWAATSGGLARIQGISFETFNEGLPSLYVRSLYKKRNGNLLAITDMGIMKVTSTLDTAFISPLVLGTLQPTDSTVSFPKSIYEDRKSRLWISERNSISTFSEDNTLKRFNFPEKDKTFDFLHSFSLAEDNLGTLYAISIPGNLYRFNEELEEFEELELPNEVGVAYQLMHQQANRFLLATSEGLFDLRTYSEGVLLLEKISSFGFISMAKGEDDLLLAASIYDGIFKVTYSSSRGYILKRIIDGGRAGKFNAIYIDKNTNIWASTDKGVLLYPPAFFGAYAPKIINSFINDIEKSDADYSVYVAESGKLHQIKNDSSELFFQSPQGAILQVISQGDNLWISTSNEKLYQLDAQGNPIFEVDFSEEQAIITSMIIDKEENVWGVPNNMAGIIKVDFAGKISMYHDRENVGEIYSVIKKSSNGTIYLGGTDTLNYLKFYDYANNEFINLSQPLPKLKNSKSFMVNDMIIDQNDKIYLATSEGLMVYEADSVRRVYLGVFSNNTIRALADDLSGNIWLGTDQGVIKFTGDRHIHFNDKNGLPSEDIVPRAMLTDSENKLWIGTSFGLVKANNLASYEFTQKPIIRSLGNDGVVLDPSQFNYHLKSGTYLQQEIVCLQYPNEYLLYQFRLVGEENGALRWSNPSREPTYFIPKLELGEYTLEARARQQGNYTWSDAVRSKLIVTLPWYQTWWAIGLYILGFFLVVYGFVLWYTSRLVKEKQKLEAIVSKRTAQLEKQKEIVEKSNAEIKASINYAKRIQVAALPNLNELTNVFEDAFVYYEPKDIVSGDFYWFYRREHLTYLVASDCTGHGVPGAFMSIAGNTMLNQAIEYKEMEDPADILKDMHLNIRRSFKQAETHNRDGMDISICVINHETNTLRFAGAQTYLLYIQNGQMYRIRGNRQPVGGQQREKERVFQSKEIDIDEPTSLYLFSDGYQDQFGGPNEKKFMAHRFRDLLLDIHEQPMRKQHAMLKEVMNEWISESPSQKQTDDMLVIGVRYEPVEIPNAIPRS